LEFRNGLTSAEYAEHSGHPSTSRTDKSVDQVIKLVLENRRTAVYEVASMSGISFWSFQSF
jgi:hypothetical protein